MKVRVLQGGQYKRDVVPTKICKCGCVIDCSKYRGSVCFTCLMKARYVIREQNIITLVGNSCWICEYSVDGSGLRLLCFHHMDPTQKQFGLTKREIGNHTWKKVLCEVQKCALLCSNCHAEVHAGFLDVKRVDEAYRKRWKIGGRSY